MCRRAQAAHAQREVRDALSGTLYSGTSEMQRKIIASCLGL
jgi:alkylation response protein AidB-like acyl-CoA dehydrogenase